MPELERAVLQPDEPGALRRAERGQVDAEYGRGPLDGRQIAGITGGRQSECAPGGGTEGRDLGEERAADPGGHQQRRALGGQLKVLAGGGQLQQPERVSGSSGVQPRGGLGRESGHELEGFLAGEAIQFQHRQAGAVQHRRLARADSDQHRDAVSDQAADGEEERLGAGYVKPLRIVE